MIRSVLCFLGFHKFSEPEVIGYFEKIHCEHCKRRWCINTHNQKVWELTPR
jgi:hypothetical protein